MLKLIPLLLLLIIGCSKGGGGKSGTYTISPSAGMVATGTPDPVITEVDSEVIIILSYNSSLTQASACSISNPANLSITTPCSCDVNGVCSVGVTGNLGYEGEASFDFTLSANGQTSNTVTQTLSFAVFNTPAVAIDGSSNAQEDTEAIVTLNYSDVENDLATSCTISNLSDLNVSTPCACSNGVCTVGVTGTQNFVGSASFEFIVLTNGQASNSAAQTVNIANVDDAPVVINGSSSAQEDTAAVVNLPYADLENNAASACTISNPTNLTVTTPCACSTGVCSVGVTGTENYSGSASFSFTVTANGLTSNTATHSITISSVDDAPVASNGSSSVNEEAEAIISLSYTDAENNSASACTISSPSNLSITTPCACSAGLCSVGVTGTENYFGAAGFNFTVTAGGLTSGTATHALTISNVDDAPVAISGTSSSLENTESIISLEYSDLENDLATSCTISSPTNLTVTTPCACSTGICSVGVTGTADFVGSASFNFVVASNSLTSNLVSHALTIDEIPDSVPVAQNISPGNLGKDVQNIITLSYTDVENDEATTCAVSDLSHLTVTETCACSDGVCSVGVTGATSYEGAVSFKYTVTSNGLNSNEATASFSLVALSPFITKWSVSGNATRRTVTLPLVSGYNYNFTVNWGDGTTKTVTSHNDANRIHTYAASGTYTVTITGTLEAWSFLDSDDTTKLKEVSLGSVGWKNLSWAFASAELDSFTCGDTSQVTDMSYMFDAVFLNGSLDLSSCNTTNVTNMNAMFVGFINDGNLIIGGEFDTSKVTSMNSMFAASGIVNVDFTKLDTISVTDMSGMFASSNFANLNLSSFNTAKVTNMSSMFENAGWLTSVDARGWDVSKVINSNNIWFMDGEGENAGQFNVECDQDPLVLFGKACVAP